MEIEAGRVRRKASRKISNLPNNKKSVQMISFLSFTDAFCQQLNIESQNHRIIKVGKDL